MAYPVLKWHKLLRGSLMRRVVLKAFMLVLALIVVSLVKIAHEVNVVEPIMSNLDKCPSPLGSNTDLKPPTAFFNSALSFGFSLSGTSQQIDRYHLTKTVFSGLMEMNLLQSNAQVLCVGEGSSSSVLSLRELGLFNAFGVHRHPFFSILKRRFMYELKYEDNLFDLVFSEDIDRVSIPSLLVMEMERVLCPGGTGVMLVGTRKFYSGGLLMSFLNGSDVVHVCGIGAFTVVIFKKRVNSFASFERFRLPDDCPSIKNNKPYMMYLEPISDITELSYLPKYMNISSRNKLVYINVGVGEFADTNVGKLSNLYCSNHHKAFDVFVIDHRTSVLASIVTNPGMTFIYDPSLSGSPAAPEISPDDYLGEDMYEEVFEFVPWFNGSISDGDFVVLVMNTKLPNLNILVELFRTGAICRVDELFLHCSDAADCKSLLESLRKSGVYLHLWFGD